MYVPGAISGLLASLSSPLPHPWTSDLTLALLPALGSPPSLTVGLLPLPAVGWEAVAYHRRDGLLTQPRHVEFHRVLEGCSRYSLLHFVILTFHALLSSPLWTSGALLLCGEAICNWLGRDSTCLLCPAPLPSRRGGGATFHVG